MFRTAQVKPECTSRFTSDTLGATPDKVPFLSDAVSSLTPSLNDFLDENGKLDQSKMMISCRPEIMMMTRETEMIKASVIICIHM